MFKLKMTEPTEAQTQYAIRAYLAHCRAVAWHGRINSGAAMLPSGKPGAFRPVKFHDIDGCSDIVGQLKDGRFLAIEVKRPSWKKPTDDRERKQAAFLEQVNQAGGVGFFAGSVEKVKEVLG